MRLEFFPFYLDFKEPAGTSRGILNQKLTCLLKLYDERHPEMFGIGEAAIFPGLSPEADNRYFDKIMELLVNVRIGKGTDLSHFPSLQFGFEQAIRDFSSGGRGVYFESPFILGEKDIVINGLVWMGDYKTMLERVKEKVEKGFKCIKLKIGAIDWENELELIRYIRKDFGKESLEIRTDANGAFTVEDVFPKLECLASLGVSSIEQPIKAGNPDSMRVVCEKSPLTVALDEELIGKFTSEEKREMIDFIKPGALVLKPALCGGFSGAEEWIGLASERNIGWWVTSALESNVGLNAIAQWVATLDTTIPQGLGTGALFTNNFPSPLYLESERLRYDPHKKIDRSIFDNLQWRGL